MTKVDLYYSIAIILTLLSTLFVFTSSGKMTVRNRKLKTLYRFFPLLSVIAVIISVLVINIYYKNQLKVEKLNFENFSIKKLNDSMLLTNRSRTYAIDSITQLNRRLDSLLVKIKKQERITGENSGLKEKISIKISQISSELNRIKSYNQIIDFNDFSKGSYLSNKPTDNFSFSCPEDSTMQYLNLVLTFKDSSLVDGMAAIMIIVTQQVKIQDTGKINNYHYQEFSIIREYYQPRYGQNNFKIKNYLMMRNTYLAIGYILKSELRQKEIFFYEKVCFNRSMKD